MTINESDYLAHYGVLGMKWGVRKNPDKAYSKSIKKLRKIDSAHEKAAARVAKMDAKNYRYKVNKLANQSASAQNKATSLSSKASKLSSKSYKLQRKSEKIENKALRSISINRRYKLDAKSQKLAAKSLKLADKSGKLSDKASRFEEKAKKLDAKSKNLAYTVAKADYKDKKLREKGEKWIQRMNKEFANVKLSSVSAEDISYGKQRAVEIASRFEESSKVKHDAMGELYLGIVAASEALAHYGVKGMKWGVRKSPTKSEETKSSGGGGGEASEAEKVMALLEEMGILDVSIVADKNGNVESFYYKGKRYNDNNGGLNAILELKKSASQQAGPHGLGRRRETNVVNKPATVKKKPLKEYETPAAGNFGEAVLQSPKGRENVQAIRTRKKNIIDAAANKPEFLKAYEKATGRKKRKK